MKTNQSVVRMCSTTRCVTKKDLNHGVVRVSKGPGTNRHYRQLDTYFATSVS